MTREIKNGILYFDGCNTVELAQKYGTPLYVMSENDILERFSQLKEAFTDKYPNARVAYACKAFCTVAMMKICEREGMCIDVVSGGELYTAIKARFPPERIEFNGNNKLPEELEAAIDYGIGRIIVDGIGELKLIEDICARKDKKANILYRITPGIKADSHDYIITGKKDSKFGMPQDEEELYNEVKRAIDSPYVEFLGFHFHIGSQLFDKEPYIQALNVTLNHIKNIKDRYDFDIKEINMGGGFGVTYTDEKRKPYSYFLDPLMDRVREFYQEENAKLPALVIEPGRSIVAEAGISLYTVGRIKNIPGMRKYVSVDGGMTDNPRYILYQSDYDVMCANKANEPKTEKVTVAGKCCESGDLIQENTPIQKVEAGDLLAVLSTGAYNYSMASNYNRIPRPIVIMAKDGESRIIIRRETYEDITRNDV